MSEHRKINLTWHGPIAEHDVLCWICNEEPAVYHAYPTWLFGPCWKCEKWIEPSYGKVERSTPNWLKRMFNG